MKYQEVVDAVKDGKKVHWKNDGYVFSFVKGKLYLTFEPNENTIGLDKEQFEKYDPEDFYIKDKKKLKESFTFGEYIQYLKESKESDKESIKEYVGQFPEKFEKVMKDLNFKYNNKTNIYENVLGTLNDTDYVIEVELRLLKKDTNYITRFVSSSKNDKYIIHSDSNILPFAYAKDMRDSDYVAIAKNINDYIKRSKDVYDGISNMIKNKKWLF